MYGLINYCKRKCFDVCGALACDKLPIICVMWLITCHATNAVCDDQYNVKRFMKYPLSYQIYILLSLYPICRNTHLLSCMPDCSSLCNHETLYGQPQLTWIQTSHIPPLVMDVYIFATFHSFYFSFHFKLFLCKEKYVTTIRCVIFITINLLASIQFWSPYHKLHRVILFLQKHFLKSVFQPWLDAAFMFLTQDNYTSYIWYTLPYTVLCKHAQSSSFVSF